MPVHYTESIVITRAIVRTAVKAGADAGELLAAVGMEPADLEESDGRVPAYMQKVLLEEAVRLSGDDALGIHAGEWLEPDPSNLSWYILLSCPNLREGGEQMRRYFRLLSDAVYPELEVSEAEWRIVMTTAVSLPVWPRHLAEFTLSIWAAMNRKLVGESFPFLEVRFQHARPGDISEHCRYFQAPVRFDQPRNELVLDRALLDRPNPTADPHLGEMLRHYAETRLAGLASGDDFIDRVRRAITEALHGGDAGLTAVSRELSMSPRTLQRRLDEHGVSYKELVDTLRREFAGSYLQDRKVAIFELSYLLGYSSLKAFYRAFHRWYGTTPAEYRRALHP